MEFELAAEPSRDADVLAVPVFANQLGGVPWPDFVKASGFVGRTGETLALPGPSAGEPATVLFGVGAEESVEATTLRRAAAGLARAVRRYRRPAVQVPVSPVDRQRILAMVVEGLLLGGYRFTQYKSGAERTAPDRVELILDPAVDPAADRDAEESDAVDRDAVDRDGADRDGAERDVVDREAVDRARRRVAGVLLARDLGNEPGGVLTPSAFAERAVEAAERGGLTCEVWDEDRIRAERLGGLLGVSRGSTQPPRLVVLRYQPTAPRGAVALVGKGVTFDSGGLTHKTNQMMLKMKIDMAGAAAVLGACSVLRDLQVGVEVTAWLPLTDNMSGGDATRLGDVLRTRNGTTVEVRNADAEGRLILADALALATEQRPDAIIDVATLTDGIPVALGGRYAGLAGNHAGWTEQVAAAARRAGELVWPLPLSELDRPLLESRIADLNNEPGKRYGQSASAALFLREFVGPDIPWAHLDMAGPAFVDEDDGEWTAGATGFGVLTLLELLTKYERP